MKSMIVLSFAIVVAFGAGLSGEARADTIFEVEHARANARAGGPVSEYDRELLDRWGALSGTYTTPPEDRRRDRRQRFRPQRHWPSHVR